MSFLNRAKRYWKERRLSGFLKDWSRINFGIVTLLYFFFYSLLLVGYAFVKLLFSKFEDKQKIISIDNLKIGDVIVTGTNAPLKSWYIKISNILTNGLEYTQWTHVALHTGSGNLIEAQLDGIENNTIGNYIKNGVLVRVFRHKYMQKAEDLQKTVNFCVEQQKKDCRYGKMGLVFYVGSIFLPQTMGFIFNNKLIDLFCNLDDAYFCSELVADAFKISGYPISPFDSWRIKPSDFIKNPFFEEITFRDKVK